MNLKYSVFKKYYKTSENGDYAFSRAFFSLDFLFYTACFNFIYMIFISEVKTISFLSLTSSIFFQVVYYLFSGYEYLIIVESMQKTRFYLYLSFFILLPVFLLFLSYLIMHFVK